ncbi:hypothetical protein LO763_22580 [Glycomyces sp. A-F 0318]|uniref:hypothetical protein n=1 Tax=Glycomyces amatae TaxID=2881355 RepID=UPI001E2AF79E|nr:hypothetical protein [Glycomyces amatae]MCD0446406.1 hypothetical protein [Glycomyces amatae]
MYRSTTRTAAERGATALLKAAEAHEAEQDASVALADSNRAAQQAILGFVAASPAVTGYSARNLHFVYRQFTRRAIAPTALDTWAGWVQRGRVVIHGEKAAKVFVPKTVQGQRCFRPVGSVFDISQTRAMGPAEWADMLAAKRLERVELPDARTLGAACLEAFADAMRTQARERFGVEITGCPAELLAVVTALADAAASAKAAAAAAPLATDAEAALDRF